MDSRSLGGTGMWHSVCSSSYFLDSNGKSRHLIQLLYLPFTNTILGVTSDNVVLLFDARSGKSLQNFRVGCRIGRNLLLCYHNCSGSIVLSDGLSLGYRCHVNGMFRLKTILQVPLNSDADDVAVELSISEAKHLMDMMGDDVPRSAVSSSYTHCLDAVLEILVKEVNLQNSDVKVLTSESSGYHYWSKLKPISKWTSIHISVQHSILNSACETLLRCYQNEPLEEGMVHARQCHILDGMTIISSILHQLTLLYSTEGSESSTLPDSHNDAMCSELSRRRSFANWPHSNYRYARPSKMAEAGFFHQPASPGDDRAICFACKVCLVCWEPTDEPWSEHERHSPLCPFVRCEPTLNVPISITHANQPASAVPLLRCSSARQGCSGAQIDFLDVAESCSLVVAASREGNFIHWDTSYRMPVLHHISTISKSQVLHELKNEIANIDTDGSQRFHISANLHIEKFSLTSLCVIDCLQMHPTGVWSQKLETHARSSREFEYRDDNATSNTRPGTELPVLAIGAQVKLAPTAQEYSVEEMQANLYYSLLIFTSSEHFSTSNCGNGFVTPDQTPFTADTKQSGMGYIEPTRYDSLEQEGKYLPDLQGLEITDSSDSIHVLSNEDCQLYEASHADPESLTNLSTMDPSFSKERTAPMKVLQVVMIDHKEDLISNNDVSLQIIKNIAVTKDSTKLVVTSSLEEITSTESSHFMDFGNNIMESKVSDGMRGHEHFVTQKSCQSAKKYGLVTVFDIMVPGSFDQSSCKLVNVSDCGKSWIATPKVNQMFELPHSLITVTCNDEADVDSADEEFSIRTTDSNCKPKSPDNLPCIDHPIMLMLGDDGLLRLFDVKLATIVHEVKPDDDTTDQRYTAMTYCPNIYQVCAINATGRVSFIKIEKHLHPKSQYVPIDNSEIFVDSDKKLTCQNRPNLKKEDLVNHSLMESSLQMLLKLTTFEKLEPRFHSKTPSHWIEIQLNESVDIDNRPTSIEESFIPRKARMDQSSAPIQVQQHRRHLRHPNQHYSSDAYRYMRAWRMHHDCAKEETVELIFPSAINISHIDLQFVLTQKLEPGTDIQITLLKSVNIFKEKLDDVEISKEFGMKFKKTVSAGSTNCIYRRIQHLLTECFVERALDKTPECPILLVTAEKVQKENHTELMLMDGSKETIVAICQTCPSGINCGSVVKVKDYMTVKVGTDNIRIVVKSVEVYPLLDFPLENNPVNTIMEEEGDNDLTVHHENFNAKETNLEEPSQSKCKDSSREQYPKFESSDILFGPVLVSDYVDVTGLGGVITIASRWLTKYSRHKSLLLLLENCADVASRTNHDRDERNGEFCCSTCLQEISVVVFKSKRVDIMHERAQRFGLLCSRSLHAKLLLGLCQESTFTQMFAFNSLSEKIMALDILNWVAALETADPNEQNSSDFFLENSLNTTAATRTLPQCQSLTYLLCFYESNKITLSKYCKPKCSAEIDNSKNSCEQKFELESFLINCLLKFGRDVGIRTLHFIYRTILSVNVTGHGQFKDISGTEVLYNAVIKSLKYATDNSVKSTHGIYCLYKILYVMFTANSRQYEGKTQLKAPMVKLQECIELLVGLSSCMENCIHPLTVTLRARYGLYTSPFDFAVMASDLDYLKQRKIPKSDNTETPTHTWEKYFSEEDVDMCVFTTPQTLGCSEVLSACGINSGYYSVQLACIECQPLHFTCIHSSEGCTFRSEGETMDEWLLPNPFFTESLESIHDDIRHASHCPFMDNVKSDLNNSAYVNNILEFYTTLGNEFAEDNSSTKHQSNCSKDGTDGCRHCLNAELKKEEAAPKSSKLRDGQDDLDPQSNKDKKYHIPNLSFLPPHCTYFCISRMHSGGRRSAILDFRHIIELTDINIPACKNLASVLVEAWPVDMKTSPTIDAAGFFTVAISLDICDYDLSVSIVTPTLLTRFLRVTAIGRYGSSNTQTVVNLGSFHGRPACICLRAPASVEQNHGTRATSAETAAECFFSHKGNNQSNGETSAFRITDTIIATEGRRALKHYLASLRNYSESLNCQYELASSELQSIITLSSSNFSCFNAQVGSAYRTSSVQAVSQAYKECIELQLQRTRVQHAIVYVESVCNSPRSHSTMIHLQAQQSFARPQIELHCELMLNLLLSIYPHVSRSELQILDAVCTSSSAKALFKNLMSFSHSRIRVLGSGVLLSYYAPFPCWGSFIVSCLTNHFSQDHSRNQGPSQSHIFCNVLVLGQRSLMIPGKGEEVIEVLLNYVSTILSNSTKPVKPDVNFKLLSVSLLLLSHLTESILTMNESFVGKSNPHILSPLIPEISLIDGQKFSSHAAPPSCSEKMEVSEPGSHKAGKNAQTGLWHPDSSKHDLDSVPALSCLSPVAQPGYPTMQQISNSWDFMSLSGFQNMSLNSIDHHAKILQWLQAVNTKLQLERTELMQLGHEECLLHQKINALGENTDSHDELVSLKIELCQVSKKASQQYKSLLGYRRVLDRKAVKSMLQQSKPYQRKSQDSASLPQASFFINVPMKLCKRVVKQILSLLLQHVFTMPADLVVLSCKVCSQLCHWACLQCVSVNGKKLIDDCQRVYYSPLSLTNLLSPDELTKLIMLASGNISTPPPTTYHEGPWVCHALRNLLCDLLKYENVGMLSHTASECSTSLLCDGIDFTLQHANPPTSIGKKPPSWDSIASGHQNHEDFHDSRIQVVDNFIHLSEVLITDVRNLIKSREDPAESRGGMNGYTNSVGATLKKPAPPEGFKQFLLKSEEFYQKMQEFVQASSPTVQSGPWNAKYPEDIIMRHPLCSHVLDQCIANGIGRKVLLASKCHDISIMESIANSLSIPPSWSYGGLQDHGKFFEGCGSTADYLKTIRALQMSIHEILDCFSTHNMDFSAICYTIFMIQRSCNSMASNCIPSSCAQLNVIELYDMQKLLNIATSDSVVFCTDNVKLWNLILNLLNSVINITNDTAEVQKMLEHDDGLSNFLIRVLSTPFSASCFGLSHVHQSLPMLGPSVCNGLERLFEHLHAFATSIEVQDPVQSLQPKITISENLKIFYINILSSMVDNSAFYYTSQAPVDGQIVFVKSVMKVYHVTSNDDTFSGDSTSLINVVHGISDAASRYLAWSKTNVTKDQNLMIGPSVLVLNAAQSDKAHWLSNSPRDELMLDLLKFVSILCQENIVLDVKMREQNLPSIQPVSDLIFEEENTIHALLSALSISTGSTVIQKSVDSFLLDLQITATTTCEGVLFLLLCLYNSKTVTCRKVRCLMSYLKGLRFYHRNQHQEYFRRTSSMSYPLLVFITQVFSSPGPSVNAFIAEGGMELLISYLVASLKQGFDPRSAFTSQTMQYLAAASERSEALTSSQSLRMQAGTNRPVTKGLHPHSKIAMKEKYYGYATETDAAMWAPSTHSRLAADSWKTQESFDFATIASVTCSDPAAPPPDSLLKPKTIHRRARTPVWSYHFQGNNKWVSLSLHFPVAFVLKHVKLLPMILSLSTSPSAVILEVCESGIRNNCNYQPLSTPLATSGMGDIILIPPTEEVVSSIRILLKRPLDSSSIGLTRISVYGTSFMCYQAPSIKPNNFMKFSPTMLPISNDTGPNTSSSIWILLLYHFVCLRDSNILQEIQNTAVTIDEAISTLCTLLELSSLPSISHAIETILLKVMVAAKPVALIDCIFKSHCKTRNLYNLVETLHDPSHHFIQIVYEMCTLEDADLQLRLERCLHWITESPVSATTYDIMNDVKADYIHAISCGLWQCSDTKSAKNLVSDSLLKNVYDSIEIIACSQPFKAPFIHYSSKLKQSLDWVLCSFCQINVNCYLSVLKWMGLDHISSKSTFLTSGQIETLASVTQTKNTADIFLSRGIIHVFANGLQRFCKFLITLEHDDTPEINNYVEVNTNNAVVVVEFFSHLCNIPLIQCWLGSEQGSKCWHALMRAVDHAMLAITQGAATVFPISLLMDLQESAVNLLKRISRYNKRNCRIVSSAICNMISSHCGKPGHRLPYSSFLRSLLLQVILEDENVMVYIQCGREEQVQCGKVANNVSYILHHPMFGTGHFNRVFEISINSSIKDVSLIVAGKYDALSKHYRRKRKVTTEPASNPGTNFVKSSTYTSFSKSANQIPVISLSPEDVAHIQASGKNAQDKRESHIGNSQPLLAEQLTGSISPQMLFTCGEVKIGPLSPDVTLAQILERYQALETSLFFNRIQLEISYPKDASAHQRKKCDMSSNLGTDNSNKHRHHEKWNADKKVQYQTIFQVFAESGGLHLIASHLPSLALHSGPVSVNDTAKVMSTENHGHVDADFVSCLETVPEWIGFNDDDFLFPPFDDTSHIHPGVEISTSSGLPKPPPPTKSSCDTPSSPMEHCVPSFTFSALRSFLQVPLFAEELMKDCSAAKCLLRLALGVVNDGKRQFIPGLALAPTLSLLPFHALLHLLSKFDCSTPTGLMIREAMVFQTISLHIIIACISRFSQIEPNTDSSTGKLLKFVLSQGFSSFLTRKKSAIIPEKNYWAQGTGFGTGSTSSDWNPEEMRRKQKKDEECLTIFIQILTNFVCPSVTLSDIKAAANHEAVVTKCISNANLVERVTELVLASGLLSAVASYLRNDSVLDMSSHVPLYNSLMSMIQSFSLCPSLRQLLINRAPTTEDSGNIAPDSIVDLITKMKTCIDTYSNRLEALNTSLDVHGDEGFSFFVSSVQKTENVLRTIMEDKNQQPQDSNMNVLSQLSSPMQSLEEVYMEKMKHLQFDTALLVQEDDKGNYDFPCGHHYKTQIKETANAADVSRARRLAQETVTLSNSLPISLSSTVFVRCDEERLDVMKVLITGPLDTPYANGCFEFDVFFPTDYNKSPPLINLCTTGNQSVRFNPNLYNDGKVCLSILNTWHGRPEERWNPQTSSFLQILVSIQSLILVKEPYFNEPGYERSRGTPAGQQCSLDYDANIQQATVKWAMLEQLRRPSECFRNVILNHFWMKKNEILEQCENWLAEMKKHASQPKSRKSIAQNYSALQRYVSQLQAELSKLDCPPSSERNAESEE